MNRTEAIKKIRQMSLPKETMEILEALAPELKESEEERIRKAILGLTYLDGIEPILIKCSITAGDIRTYLEKQKEASKAIEAIERIDKFIDEYLANAHDMKDSDPDKKYYLGWDDALGKMSGILQDVYSGEKQKEQKPAEVDESTKRLNDNWMKQHFDDYEEQKSAQSREEILHQLFQNRSISLSLSDYLYLTGEQKPAEWSEEDVDMLNSCISSIEEAKENRYAYKETDGDTSYDHEIAWLKSLRPQPKKELSIEKAIQWLDDTFYFLDNSSGRGRDCEITTHDFDSLEEMYDSFRKAVTVDYRPSWKPSEEQLKALFEAMQETRPGWLFNRQLVSLYDDLKKL